MGGNNWFNIFSNVVELVNFSPHDCYVITWRDNKCIMLRNGFTIIENPKPILERYNIFDAKMIGVDYGSFGIDYGGFKEDMKKSFSEIAKIIIEQFSISYIKKIILNTKLSYKKLENYLQELNCVLLGKEEVYEDCFILTIKDNLGDIYKLDARFSVFDDYAGDEEYWSKIKII